MERFRDWIITERLGDQGTGKTQSTDPNQGKRPLTGLTLSTTTRLLGKGRALFSQLSNTCTAININTSTQIHENKPHSSDLSTLQITHNIKTHFNVIIIIKSHKTDQQSHSFQWATKFQTELQNLLFTTEFSRFSGILQNLIK